MENKARVISLRQRLAVDESLPDAALVAACGQGDMGALAALYERHAPRVAGFLARLRHIDADETEDLTQEVFLAARRTASAYRGECTVGTWLLAIAGNLARTGARSAVRRRAALVQARTQVSLSLVGPDTESQAVAREELMLLQRALHALPHELRVTFVMCELEEVPGHEAARALKLRQGTLYRRLHDARKKLRAAIGRERP